MKTNERTYGIAEIACKKCDKNVWRVAKCERMDFFALWNGENCFLCFYSEWVFFGSVRATPKNKIPRKKYC